MSKSIYEFSAKNIKGEEISLETYRGKVLLVVNTASKCGFTPQYTELQKLYEEYRDQGLEILGFPCDQFGHQEPGNEEEIQQFCSLNFGVTFPLFSKVDVNGGNAHPLFRYLTKALPGLMGGRVKWNFTKFLIAPDGTPVKRFAPTLDPARIGSEIRSLLKDSAA